METDNKYYAQTNIHCETRAQAHSICEGLRRFGFQALIIRNQRTHAVATSASGQEYRDTIDVRLRRGTVTSYSGPAGRETAITLPDRPAVKASAEGVR